MDASVARVGGRTERAYRAMHRICAPGARVALRFLANDCKQCTFAKEFDMSNVNLLAGRHLLQALGLNDFFFSQLDQYQGQLGPLRSLQDQFFSTSGGLSPLSL